MKRFACLAIPLALAACGDNQKNTGDIDAPPAPIDGPTIDTPTPIDAPIIDAPNIDAAPVANYSGTISVVEARLKNMGGAGVDGHGVQIGVSFINDASAVPPIAMTPGATTTDGCFVWRYTVAQLATTLGTDQGPVQITIGDGNPTFPRCIFQPGAGYICPDTASSGVGGTLAVGPSAGTSTFTGATFAGGGGFSAEDVGRYIRLSGTGVAALDTAFPIVAVASSSTVVIAGASVALALPAAATFTTLAGVGPIPVPSFDPLSDDDAPTATKSEGTPDVDNFTNVPLSIGGASVGDNFTLGTGPSSTTPTINKVLPTAIPLDGSEFVVGCDSAAECGTSIGSLINIVTTDAPVAGLSPFGFPTPVATRTQIRCTKLSARDVRVPAEISAFLRPSASGATRVQTTFIRGNFAIIGDTNGATARTNFLGGHGEVGFTTVP